MKKTFWIIAASIIFSFCLPMTTKAASTNYSTNICNDVSYETNVISQEDLYLIALICMAEAEGESIEGKRLVIDTVLNRVDSDKFPNTIKEVIFQRNQFSSLHNGRIERVSVNDEVLNLVREEINNRLNSNCVFFTAGGYSRYGEPMFQVGNHYFSGC